MKVNGTLGKQWKKEYPKRKETFLKASGDKELIADKRRENNSIRKSK